MSYQFSKSECVELRKSLLAGMFSRAERRPLVGLIREAHDELARNLPPNRVLSDRSILVPLAGLARGLTAGGSPTSGGALVENAQTAVEQALIPVSAVIKSGAKIILNGTPSEMAGLSSHVGASLSGRRVGMVSVPYDNGVSGGWYEENETAISSDNSFGSLNMDVHRWTLATNLSTQLAAQSTAPEALAASIARAAGSGLDQAAISGSGANGEPCGILAQANVGTVTHSGAATWIKILDYITQVENAKADAANGGWILHPAVKARWANIQRWSGASTALFDVATDTIAGKPALVSTHASATLGVVFGAWAENYKIALWGANAPIEIIVNPYTKATAGLIEYTANLFADCGTGRPTAFCRAADTAVA